MGNEKEQDNKLIALLDSRKNFSLNSPFGFLFVNYPNQPTNNSNKKWYSNLEKNAKSQSKPSKPKAPVEGVDYPFEPKYTRPPVPQNLNTYRPCSAKIMLH